MHAMKEELGNKLQSFRFFLLQKWYSVFHKPCNLWTASWVHETDLRKTPAAISKNFFGVFHGKYSYENTRKTWNTDFITLQSLTGSLQGRITSQGDPCSHYREWVWSVVNRAANSEYDFTTAWFVSDRKSIKKWRFQKNSKSAVFNVIFSASNSKFLILFLEIAALFHSRKKCIKVGGLTFCNLLIRY